MARELFDILTTDKIQTTATDVGTTMELLATLNAPSREAGTYSLELGFVHNLPTISFSVEWQVIVNGNSSPIFRKENQDSNDFEPMFYGFEIEHLGGIKTIEFWARKTGGQAELNFSAINLAWKRTG